MKTSRTLTLIAALAATVAWAKVPKDLPEMPCAEKGAEAHQKCSAECFKVDPNKKDQVPTKAEVKCMEGCGKKGTTISAKCEAEALKKAEAGVKKTKNQAEKEVEY
jgi:hypothetical protein